MDETDRRHLIEGRAAGARYALAPPRSVPMGLVGSQSGRRAGSSLEFRDHREYQPGDDLRRIDWAAFARSDRLHVKLYREEINPHLDLLLDGSGSMDLEGTQKRPAALALAAAFATAAENSGYTRAASIARDACEPILNANLDPAEWRGLTFDHAGPLDESIARHPPRWRARSIRVLVSDLLWMGDPMAVLGPMARQAAAVVVVQLLAQADAEPPEHGNLRLVDSETGDRRDIFLDAAARRRYRTTLAGHQENWSRAARRIGAVMTTLIAEPLLRDWNLAPLVEAQVLQPA